MVANKLLNKASNALQRKDLQGARRWLEKSLKANPGDFDTLYLLGTTLAQLGERTAARRHLERAAALAPRSAMIQTNLGILHKQESDLPGAVQYLDRAIQLDPRLFEAHYNHAVVSHLLWRLPEALHSADAARRLNPASLPARLIQAQVQRDIGDGEAAAATLDGILRQHPDHPAALRMLGNLRAEQGDIEAACALFERIVAREPDDVGARHALSVLRGEAPSLTPVEYTRQLFDGMAPSFDAHLSQLGYRGPARLLELLGETAYAGRRFRRMLDIGCGTGAAGRVFRERVEALTGLDLAPDMVARARASGAYDRLYTGTIEDLPDSAAGFDLIVAADVLCYIGDLALYLAGVRPLLADDGLLLFTTERSGEPSGYRVDRSSGRYQFSDAYLAEVAEGLRFETLDCQVDRLRREHGRWLEGHYCVWRRSVD